MHLALHPIVLAVKLGTHLLCQRDGGAAWGVELVNVVCLYLAHVVSGVSIHDAGQIFVDSREDGYAQRKV